MSQTWVAGTGKELMFLLTCWLVRRVATAGTNYQVPQRKRNTTQRNATQAPDLMGSKEQMFAIGAIPAALPTRVKREWTRERSSG